MNRKNYSLQYVSAASTAFHYKNEKHCQALIPGKLGAKDCEILNVVRGMFAFSKYHPGNPYLYRKAIPSPRSIHPFVPIVIAGGRFYLYDAGRDAFAYLGKDSSRVDDWLFILCLDIWRTCSAYGEFGFPLSLLESGHILAEFQLSAREYAYRIGRIDFSFKLFNEDYPEVKIENARDLYVVYSVLIKSNKCINEMPHLNKAEARKVYNYKHELTELGMDQLFYRASMARISFIHRDYPTITDYTSKRAKRNSLNARIGLFNLGRQYPKYDFNLFLNFLNEVTGLIKDKYINIYIVINNIEGFHPGGYRIDEKLHKISDDISLYNLLMEGQQGINIDSLPFMMLLTYSSAANNYKEFITSHVNAAEIIQILSIYFANINTFTRPIKNINDSYCKSVFHTSNNEYFIFSCLFGYGNPLNEIVLR